MARPNQSDNSWKATAIPKSKRPEYPLQPLRIPIGWKVEWNTFSEIDPRHRPWADVKWEFKSDMLLIKNWLNDIALSLDWFPEFQARGSYWLQVILLNNPAAKDDSDWNHPLEELRTRSKAKLVATLDRWLHEYVYFQRPEIRVSET